MKRLVKVLVSLSLGFFDWMYRCVLGLLGRKAPGTCVILYYHAVNERQRERFARQMDDVVRFTTPIRAHQSAKLVAGERYCALTFDDGFLSVMQNALPELEQRDIPCTIFVPTGSLGQRPKWVENPCHPAFHETVIDASQLEIIKNHELVTIGSHSVSHPNFLGLKNEEARLQFSESKHMLERILGIPVLSFSFPHGACNAGLLAMARATGYDQVFTIKPEALRSVGDRFVYGRVPVGPEDWEIEFRLKLMGAYRWMSWGSDRSLR